MKIVVYGCGAMGSVYAGNMAEAGNEVWGVDLWTEHVAAINRDGLKLTGASGDRIISGIRATSDIAEALPADLIILATKADGVRPAALALKPFLGPDDTVLTMQNGIGAVDILTEVLPKDRILVGIAKGFGASVPEPGHAHHHAMSEIRIGEADGGESDRARKVTQVWAEAGFNAHLYPDIDRLIWEKFIGNVTLSATCTAFNVTVGEMMDRPELWNIALNCGVEAHAVGVAKGVRFGFADPVPFITDYADSLRGARPSMALDHDARRKSEIDFINGRVPVLGAETGVPTPYNECMSAIIRDIESRF